jgi:hypothetical protein
MQVGQGGNYVHKPYSVAEDCSHIVDIMYVSFCSPVVQISGMMFSGYGIKSFPPHTFISLINAQFN